MSDRNDNTYYECSDFIRYLYQECLRKNVPHSPRLYSEIIKFAKSSEGRNAYKKFISINPSKFGNYSFKKNLPTRISQS